MFPKIFFVYLFIYFVHIRNYTYFIYFFLGQCSFVCPTDVCLQYESIRRKTGSEKGSKSWNIITILYKIVQLKFYNQLLFIYNMYKCVNKIIDYFRHSLKIFDLVSPLLRRYTEKSRTHM